MPFILPALPYEFDALEPYIDALTMEIHYTKHHQGYVNNLNNAIENYRDLQQYSVEELLETLDTLPDEIRASVRNNGGGHANHSFFWKIMKKGGSEPKGSIIDAIRKQYNHFDAFKDKFSFAAKSRFGSGWAWLSVDNSGKLVISSTANQDSLLLEDIQPVLGLDVWEHAYYLQYHNRRADYIDAWWQVVNWEQVEENYRNIIS